MQTLAELLPDWDCSNTAARTMYCFHPKTGKVTVLESSVLVGILATHRKSGKLMTCYGIAPWDDLYGAAFYSSELELLATIVAENI